MARIKQTHRKNSESTESAANVKDRCNVLPTWWLERHVAAADDCPIRRVVLKDCNCAAPDSTEFSPCVAEPGSYMIGENLYMEALAAIGGYMYTDSRTYGVGSSTVLLQSQGKETPDYLDTIVENLAFDIGADRISFGPMELADFASDLLKERLFEPRDCSFLQLSCQSDDEEKKSYWALTFAEWAEMNEEDFDERASDCGSESSELTDCDTLSDNYNPEDKIEPDEDPYDFVPGLTTWSVYWRRSRILKRLFTKSLRATRVGIKQFKRSAPPYFPRHQPRICDIPVGGTIIHVREMDRLKSHAIAGRILAFLEHQVDCYRRRGHRILIVGTAQEEVKMPTSAWMSSWYNSDDRQLLISVPSCLRHQETLIAGQTAWIRENNTRLLKSMFRSGIVAARTNDLFQPLTPWELAVDSPLNQQLSSKRLPFNVWRRFVVSAELKLRTSKTFDLADLEAVVKRTILTPHLRGKKQTLGTAKGEASGGSEGEGKSTEPKGEGKPTEVKNGDKPNISTSGSSSNDVALTLDFEELKDDCDKYEQAMLSGIVEAGKLKTTMNDIELDPSIIEALEDMTMLPLRQPEQFKYGLLATQRMSGALLFGPPGTGKTLLARAIAQRRSVHVLEVSGADVHQKYVGEAEKIVRAIFSLGRKLRPCVVFIDEADSIFGSRSSGMHRADRNVVNQFLREWDGLSSSTGGDITMLVATNRPFDLDSAVLRRLPRRLFLDLPSVGMRQKILQIMLRDEQVAEDVDLASIAIAAEKFSGSDLKNVCLAAALRAVRDSGNQGEADTAKDASSNRILTNEHFVKAMAETRASTDADLVSQIRKFNKEFGSKAGRR
ncbi:hypothetical protein LTR84_010435 [Exophiala bonariae]|uniref:AAA+ ATPase domain-containing protein n=1 Tax=Exophiala bonariae TaxID=1690606 RepID=A0AAV9MTM7_9EURO|nr:hypothetical protein LTR84_010435 [Exophiala bonariae]